MPIYRVGRERESLMYTGEAYKGAVRRFLESMGYSETTDSYIEGHLPDMVFYNKDIDPGREFWVEAKASRIGPSNKAFRKELLSYLRLWLDLGHERNFRFLIFIQEEQKRSRLDPLFGDSIEVEFIDEWLKKGRSLISNDDWNVISNAPSTRIYPFFQETKVWIGPAYKLEIAAEKRAAESKLSPSRKAKELLGESERRNHLIESRSNLAMNFIEIELPKRYLSIASGFKRIEDIWKRTSESIQPPFAFDGKRICTFCSEEDMEPMKNVISGQPRFLKTADLLANNTQELTRLVNFHIDKIARCQGLRKHTFKYYSLPEFTEREEIKARVVKSHTGRNRTITSPVFEEVEDSGSVSRRLYYVFHRAVEIPSSILWGRVCVLILPSFHFTKDGKAPITGINRDRLDRKYRNPVYNRSRTFLSWTRFWKYHIFDRPFSNPTYENWFKDFGFRDLESFQVIGVPKSIDKTQSLMWEYTEETDGV
jgi:hypothetical protein